MKSWELILQLQIGALASPRGDSTSRFGSECNSLLRRERRIRNYEDSAREDLGPLTWPPAAPSNPSREPIQLTEFSKRFHHQLLGYVPRIREPALYRRGHGLESGNSRFCILIACSQHTLYFSREPSRVSPSTCISPQNHNPAIHHRARSVNPAHRGPPRKLARLHHQPVNIVTRNKASRGDRHDFSAAPRASSLNLSNLVSIQQHSVTPAPSSKRSDLAARLDSQPGPYSLLYCHGHITFLVHLPASEGARKYTKIERGCQELFSKSFSKSTVFILDKCNRGVRECSRDFQARAKRSKSWFERRLCVL